MKNQSERGISILATAVSLPIVILIVIAIIDLSRMYLTIIFAQEVATFTAKIATSANPDVITPSSTAKLIRSRPGESGTIKANRQQTWDNMLLEGTDTYIGVKSFSSKELKVFNLGYGFLTNLDPQTAFPIPNGFTNVTQLGGKKSCTIKFEYRPLIEAGGSSALDMSTVKAGDEVSRLYTVECAIPLVGIALVPWFFENDYQLISRTAYAYKSGAIESEQLPS